MDELDEALAGLELRDAEFDLVAERSMVPDVARRPWTARIVAAEGRVASARLHLARVREQRHARYVGMMDRGALRY